MKTSMRTYHMSDADLCQLVSDFIVFMTRDATEFAARGVDATAITAFETLGNAFEVFPPDDSYVGEIMIEVDAKDILRETITGEIQLISGFFEQEYGLGSGQYKGLSIKNLTTMSDKKFLFSARRVTVQAEDYLTELSTIGLTQTMIDSLEANAQLFEDKLNAIADKKQLRDDKARERVEKGNELYSYLSKYSKIGKLIWENVNEARYNDYIIYHRKPGVPGKVDNLTYDVPTRTANWSSEPLADTYQLEYKMDDPAGVWTTAYEGAATSVNHDPGAGNWLYRCRGVNSSGYGYWSNVLEVEILA